MATESMCEKPQSWGARNPVWTATPQPRTPVTARSHCRLPTPRRTKRGHSPSRANNWERVLHAEPCACAAAVPRHWLPRDASPRPLAYTPCNSRACAPSHARALKQRYGPWKVENRACCLQRMLQNRTSLHRHHFDLDWLQAPRRASGARRGLHPLHTPLNTSNEWFPSGATTGQGRAVKLWPKPNRANTFFGGRTQGGLPLSYGYIPLHFRRIEMRG
jgi:hypothetical protein